MICALLCTLGAADHDLTHKNILPYPGPDEAFCRIRLATSTSFVLAVMLMKFKIVRHGDKLLDCHPRSIVVASLRG